MHGHLNRTLLCPHVYPDVNESVAVWNSGKTSLMCNEFDPDVTISVTEASIIRHYCHLGTCFQNKPRIYRHPCHMSSFQSSHTGRPDSRYIWIVCNPRVHRALKFELWGAFHVDKRQLLSVVRQFLSVVRQWVLLKNIYVLRRRQMALLVRRTV